MQKLTDYVGTVMMLLLCGGQWANAQEFHVSQRANAQEFQEFQKFQKPRGEKKVLRSLFDLIGPRGNPVLDMAWQSQFVQNVAREQFVASAAAPILVSNTNISGAPAGTEKMFSLRDGLGNYLCVQAPKWLPGPPDDGFLSVFDQTFTTGSGTSYLQVIYTAQANINDGTPGNSADGLMIQIKVTQGSSTVYVANTDAGPFMVGQTTNLKGNSLVTTYSGYVGGVLPDTSTRVQVQIATLLYAPPVTQAVACGNNLILRY